MLGIHELVELSSGDKTRVTDIRFYMPLLCEHLLPPIPELTTHGTWARFSVFYQRVQTVGCANVFRNLSFRIRSNQSWG